MKGQTHLISLLCTLVLIFAAASESWANTLDESSTSLYERYLGDTLNSLECLRAPHGLLRDKAVVLREKPGNLQQSENCPIRTLRDPSSPTNIAFDLLIQLELYQIRNGPEALNRI